MIEKTRFKLHFKPTEQLAGWHLYFVLEPVIRLWFSTMGENLSFTHDNPPPQTSRLVTNFLETDDITVRVWP